MTANDEKMIETTTPATDKPTDDSESSSEGSTLPSPTGWTDSEVEENAEDFYNPLLSGDPDVKIPKEEVAQTPTHEEGKGTKKPKLSLFVAPATVLAREEEDALKWKRLVRQRVQEVEIIPETLGVDLESDEETSAIWWTDREEYDGRTLHVQAKDEDIAKMEARRKYADKKSIQYAAEVRKWDREIKHNEYLRERVKQLQRDEEEDEIEEVPAPCTEFPQVVVPASKKRPGQRGPDKVPRRKRGPPK